MSSSGIGRDIYSLTLSTSISSANHSISLCPRCHAGWFWRGCHGFVSLVLFKNWHILCLGCTAGAVSTRQSTNRQQYDEGVSTGQVSGAWSFCFDFFQGIRVGFLVLFYSFHPCVCVLGGGGHFNSHLC